MTTTRSSRLRSALTRRRFLGHLGAVGGSSLVMTALSSWDLMAADGRHTSGAFRPSAQREGARARRRRLGPDARIRAFAAGLRFPHPRGARPGRRARLDGAWRHDAHRDWRRAPAVHVGRRAVGQRRRVAHSLYAHRRAELLQGIGRRPGDLRQRSGRLLLLLRGRRCRLAREQARAPARSQSRHRGPGERAAREGHRSARPWISR